MILINLKSLLVCPTFGVCVYSSVRQEVLPQLRKVAFLNICSTQTVQYICCCLDSRRSSSGPGNTVHPTVLVFHAVMTSIFLSLYAGNQTLCKWNPYLFRPYMIPGTYQTPNKYLMSESIIHFNAASTVTCLSILSMSFPPCYSTANSNFKGII